MLVEKLIRSGHARVIARRRNTLRLEDLRGCPVLTRAGRPVALPVEERLIAVWLTPSGAGEPAYFVRETTRPGWHFDATFGPLAEVWREGPHVEQYDLVSLQETWGRGKGWHVGA